MFSSPLQVWCLTLVLFDGGGGGGGGGVCGGGGGGGGGGRRVMLRQLSFQEPHISSSSSRLPHYTSVTSQ
jgi:hypothetical protein